MHLIYQYLEQAIIEENIEQIENLIAQGIDVNISSSVYSNLHKAVGSGNVKIVKMLLDAGAEVDVKDIDYNTPLMYAASRGNLEIVKLLINAKARIDIVNNCHETAITQAASYGQEIIVNYLYPYVSESEREIADNWLKDGIIRKQRREDCFANEFFQAVESCDYEKIHSCINRKVNLDTLTEEGETALHIAGKIMI